MRNFILVLLMLWAAEVSAICIFGIGDCSTDVDVKVDLKALAESVERLKDVDPLKIGVLLDENAQLRAKLASAADVLDGFVSSGNTVVVLQDRKLQLNVESYSGSFELTAWVDNEDNLILKDVAYPTANAILPLRKGEIVAKSYAKDINTKGDALAKSCPASGRSLPHAHLIATTVVPRFRKELNAYVARIVNLYNQEVQKKFVSYLGVTQLQPPPAANIVDLNQVLNFEGRHTIFVKVRPVAVDNVGRWAVRLALTTQVPSGELRLKTYDFRDTNYNIALGQPLPVAPFTVSVRSSGSE